MQRIRTIVAVNAPGAVLLPWAREVPSILVAWLAGQEAGNALADVLFGRITPSGKLPVTFPNTDNEINMTPRQYPGIGVPPEAFYSEELLIGYRWYDAKKANPLFPFGHGLSHTTFQYSDVKLVSPASRKGQRSLDNGVQEVSEPKRTAAKKRSEGGRRGGSQSGDKECRD